MLIASRHPSRHAAKVTQPSPLFVRLAGFANYKSTKSFSNLSSQDIVPDTSEDSDGVGGKGREMFIPLSTQETPTREKKKMEKKKEMELSFHNRDFRKEKERIGSRYSPF